MTKLMSKKLASFAALVAPVAVVTGAAVAGGGGLEFDVAVTQLVDWLEGGLGQLLALAALAVGLGIGIVQQSVMAVVVGIGMAIAVFYGPGILTGIISGAVGL
jgi:conjugal transfer pilus assembly protein TraA